MNLQELKKKTPAELITQAEKLAIENPSTLRKQEILFAILKKLAQKNEQITGGGVIEVLQDGFGFLRAIESNYLPGPDDIYVRPSDNELVADANCTAGSYQREHSRHAADRNAGAPSRHAGVTCGHGDGDQQAPRGRAACRSVHRRRDRSRHIRRVRHTDVPWARRNIRRP